MDIFAPITSPETMISTRRFCLRPAAVLLSATGSAWPSPFDVMMSADSPWEIRKSRTASRALSGQAHVVVRRAGGVRVAFDRKVQARMRLNDAGEFGQLELGVLA